MITSTYTPVIQFPVSRCEFCLVICENYGEDQKSLYEPVLTLQCDSTITETIMYRFNFISSHTFLPHSIFCISEAEPNTFSEHPLN